MLTDIKNQDLFFIRSHTAWTAQSKDLTLVRDKEPAKITGDKQSCGEPVKFSFEGNLAEVNTGNLPELRESARKKISSLKFQF